MNISIHQSVIKFLMFIAMACMACAAFAESKAPEFIDGTKRVSAEEIVQLVTSTPGLVIIDARKSSDRESAGWIEGS
ncbi:MAG TPA: hypothetical protein VIM41_04845, partial [Gammaproteobacteria bacterium]